MEIHYKWKFARIDEVYVGEYKIIIKKFSVACFVG